MIRRTRVEIDLQAIVGNAEAVRLLEPGDVAERRRHDQELRSRQLDQRDLPCPAAVGVGVEVELVHHDQADVGVGTLAQSDVGEHLRRRAMIGASGSPRRRR